MDIELERLRREACRLDEDDALASLDEAAAWIRERGVVTGAPCCSPPSLHVAIHEGPYRPGSRGFGLYPATKWWWGGELATRDGLHWLKIHRGKGVIVDERIARLADPLARQALGDAEAGKLGDDARRVVTHLAAAGPAEVSDLRAELGLDARRLRGARENLEQVGAVVTRSLVLEPHAHTSELARWDQRFDGPSAGGLDELLVAFVRSAVFVPEVDLAKLLSWPLPAGTVERLLAAGKLRRVGEYVTAEQSRSDG